MMEGLIMIIEALTQDLNEIDNLSDSDSEVNKFKAHFVEIMSDLVARTNDDLMNYVMKLRKKIMIHYRETESRNI